MTACQGVFCGGVKNSTIALPRPPSLFLFPSLSLSLSHPSLASPPIITLSSPPKCLTKLPQYLSHFSLHCSSSSTIPRTPSHFLSQSLPHSLHRDAFIASHLKLQTDTPLILLFCNLQRERKSCSTCVTFKQLHQSILYTHTFSLLSSSEVAVLCYLFSLYSQIHYSGRMDKNREWREKAIGHHRSCMWSPRTATRGHEVQAR